MRKKRKTTIYKIEEHVRNCLEKMMISENKCIKLCIYTHKDYGLESKNLYKV